MQHKQCNLFLRTINSTGINVSETTLFLVFIHNIINMMKGRPGEHGI